MAAPRAGSFAIGIDTGGTFTDGVVFDLNESRILAKIKAITTRNNLTLAINNCLDGLLEDLNTRGLKKQILNGLKMVSLSTTLATNALVEGQGADVGLILIGYECRRELPTPYYATIAGGCDIRGKIKKPVVPQEATAAIMELKGNVEAFAVSGYMSIRNPQQELEVQKLIRDSTGYPVVCGHELSTDLGVYERTVTAVLNARLIPLLAHLIDAVKESLRARNIHTVIKVVRGDGSLIGENVAREKPVETILSGPAASFIGARVLTGIDDAIVVDMGGTTTDVAILNKGKPALKEEGARVGGWLTRIRAAEITTIGLGGDSHIQVSKDRQLAIGPQKVFPLSWIVAEHPHLLEELRSIRESRYFPLNSQPTNILCLIREPERITLNETEKDILKLIRGEPHSLFWISKELDKDSNIIAWERLVNVGSIHRASLTPTDLLHVTGRFSQWNRDAAVLGVAIMAERFGTSPEKFVKAALERLHYMIFELLVEKLVSQKNSNVSLKKSEESSFLLREMFHRDENPKTLVDFMVRMNIPVIAVGAPVAAYFPEVIKKLSTDLIIPLNAEVANAAGTVNGKVTERLKVLIKPGEGSGFYVYTPQERRFFMDLDKAMDFGVENGKSLAYRRAEEAGASNIEILLEQKDRYTALSAQPDVEGEGEENADKLFIESLIEISAVGNPWGGVQGS